MLKCRDLAQHRASDYIDRQLGWRTAIGVRFHLLLCDNCRRFIAQLRRVRAMLRQRPVPGADAEAQTLAQRLQKIYQAQKKSPPL